MMMMMQNEISTSTFFGFLHPLVNLQQHRDIHAGLFIFSTLLPLEFGIIILLSLFLKLCPSH